MLSADEVQEIRLVLATRGWNHVIKPAVMNRGRQALKALALTRSERAQQFAGTDFNTEDDVLRAMIRDCEWMSVVWDNEVRVHDYNRAVAERDESSNTPPTANP